MHDRRIAAALIAAVLFILAFLPSGIAFAEADAQTFETGILQIRKHGNIELEISSEALLGMGYEYGDVISVTMGGKTIDLPLCSAYSDVDANKLVCRALTNGTEDEKNAMLAINMGDLATDLGIAKKAKIEEEPGYRWDFLVETPVKVTVSLKEKGGYADEYMMRKLVRTDARADYPHLTDEQYANFRCVETTGMGKGILYRSSSPVNPEMNRSREADEALNRAGVATILDLADSEAKIKSYEGSQTSYFMQRKVIALDLVMDTASPGFTDGLAKGLEQLAESDGPYLIHCNEGKDRTGFVCAVLECLIGATAQEVAEDYMATYFNFYGVEPGSEQYGAILRGNIEKSLAAAFGVADIYGADLPACAQKYLLSIGLDEGTVAKLKEKLAFSYD